MITTFYGSTDVIEIYPDRDGFSSEALQSKPYTQLGKRLNQNTFCLQTIVCCCTLPCKGIHGNKILYHAYRPYIDVTAHTVDIEIFECTQ